MTRRSGARRFVLLLVVALVPGLLGPVGPAAAGTVAYRVAASSTAPSGIGGYFVFAASSAAATRSMLTQIRATGADTVITFGSRLRPAGLAHGRPDSANFADCVIGAAGCVTAAANGAAINRVFTYEEQATAFDGLHGCRNDRNVAANGKSYTVLLIPFDNNGCTSTAYDAIVVLNAPDRASDRTGNLIAEAGTQGMQVFLGMPQPVQRAGAPWFPDTSYLGTLERFTERYLRNISGYGSAGGSIAGFYQSLEMPVRSVVYWDPVLSVYETQNRMIAKVLPNKKVLVSPYLDGRRNATAPTPLSDIRAGTARIAGTAAGVSMVIAPQDGQGTGRVGAFTTAERNNPVDTPSAVVAGAGTYAERYLGSTGDYLTQVVAGAAGRATVWINIELMTATTSGAPECLGAANGRGQASAPRVRHQVAVGRVPGVNKVIGFMWSPYATCGGAGSLAAAFTIVPTMSPAEAATYIDRVYRDLLNRAPDPGGLTSWASALSRGAPRASVANGITSSPEFRSRLIAGSYNRYLSRSPDPGGLATWLGAMERGWTVSQMESGFIASPEYYSRAGSTSAGWVTKLYADVLGRAAGANEVAYWVGRLSAGVSRNQVAMGFLLSTERLSTVISGHYQHLLGRGPDLSGLRAWVGILQAGGRDEAVIGGIIASDEYFAKK